MKTITIKTKAWQMTHHDPRALFGDDKDEILRNVYLSNFGYSEYAFAGDVTVTIELAEQDALVAAAVKNLEAQAKTIQAEAEKKINHIKTLISNLSALTYEPAAA